jgi:hypothetical protein
VAISASLLGVSAVATTASGLDSGTGAVHGAADNGTQQKGQGSPLATVDPVPLAGYSAPDGGGEQLFDGTFTLTRFQERGGTLYAVGRLEGELADGRAVHKQVRLPVEGATAGGEEGGPGGFARPAVPTPGACSILTLDLGPLDLNLLGLRVFLDEVNLLIEAIPGAGNLLGNLLCAVAGLLDPGGILGGGPLAGLLTAITNLLNEILGGL